MRALDDSVLRTAILDAVARRGTGKTVCPSEVARALASDWRPVLPDIRRVAAALQIEGAIVVTQKGREVSMGEVRGPVRLRQPASA